MIDIKPRREVLEFDVIDNSKRGNIDVTISVRVNKDKLLQEAREILWILERGKSNRN